ncbi:gamma-glutamyl-gamma-aminobutyrate hydrolase family protein [Actinophytocola gossypii]|uniref:Gamma-glutamyl-gamma-aminobutyrate hydrolase family protein n=1 Tax=Actinophytocola gossypii TaxID=2812003 RepID=A0ABT2JIT0_9PSEU|nr:gamma-glutamyl-gamma-aminobutyrate hydrolase family protein [Actinophytocola gossypii]MCT2587621.1 gamma-glutamyl-gamma-aminobutyrate hydrolase family protein [Actinophytocola gossypii]
MGLNASSPLIGISCYLERTRFGVWDTPAAVLPQGYLDGVVHAGGMPVLLPPVGDWTEAQLSRVDGLIIAGGADVGPERYGAERAPETGPARADRDRSEWTLIELALRAGVPLLGVCRGMQLLNAVLGGTLHQHLPDQVGNTDHQPAPGAFGRVPVKVTPGSRLGGIVGERIEVHCHHHQAIDRLGAGLVPVAHADDGTVEGVELPGAAFVAGVQWHPEEDGVDRRLFRALVGEANR